MNPIEAADLARIILDDTETDRHMDLYTLTVIEARTLARAVIDLTARLDAERFAHANTAVKVKRIEELADRLDDGHLRYLIRAALEGETA